MTMISPLGAIEELKDKSYEELLAVREEYLDYVREFEEHRNESKEPTIFPTPETVYQWNLDFLGELFKLISEKYNDEFVW